MATSITRIVHAPHCTSQLLHTLGNLTLLKLSLNRDELRNKPWSPKQAGQVEPGGPEDYKRTILEGHGACFSPTTNLLMYAEYEVRTPIAKHLSPPVSPSP
jgi:hypothetical protein